MAAAELEKEARRLAEKTGISLDQARVLVRRHDGDPAKLEELALSLRME